MPLLQLYAHGECTRRCYQGTVIPAVNYSAGKIGAPKGGKRRKEEENSISRQHISTVFELIASIAMIIDVGAKLRGIDDYKMRRKVTIDKIIGG